MMMTPDELTEFRKSLGLKQAPFGAWLADRLGQDRPYTSSEVSNWENDRRAIPWAVQAVIYKHLWENK